MDDQDLLRAGARSVLKEALWAQYRLADQMQNYYTWSEDDLNKLVESSTRTLEAIAHYRRLGVR